MSMAAVGESSSSMKKMKLMKWVDTSKCGNCSTSTCVSKQNVYDVKVVFLVILVHLRPWFYVLYASFWVVVGIEIV